MWGVLEDAGKPAVIHCGSGPAPGIHTSPRPIRTLLRRRPRLALMIAHMGMPEYAEFTEICARHDNVLLDTTMAFTPFSEERMPVPTGVLRMFPELGERILFGSDFPNIPHDYAAAMTAITTLDGIDDGWLRGVFYDNAARLFGLTPSSCQGSVGLVGDS